jgi:ParB family chromosome partitioning protein
VASRPARGLGHGLSVLLGDRRPDGTAHDTGGLLHLDPRSIAPNPRQPRARLDDEAFAELVRSVERDGVVQPVLVRAVGGGYELIAGERRWRAAQAAGLSRVPAVVREADDRESLALAVVENVVRADLSPVDQARAYARLGDEFGLSQAQIGEAVGRSRTAIANTVRLLDLPDEVLALLEEGALSEGHGRAILQVPDHAERRALGLRAARRGLTVRETEAAARRAAAGAPKARARRRAPAWYDADLANDAVDAVQRSLGLPARIACDAERCRVEISARSATSSSGSSRGSASSAAETPLQRRCRPAILSLRAGD